MLLHVSTFKMSSSGILLCLAKITYDTSHFFVHGGHIYSWKTSFSVSTAVYLRPVRLSFGLYSHGLKSKRSALKLSYVILGVLEALGFSYSKSIGRPAE
jgi:hypothetical protein